ncbi:MAG: tRNA uridine-5-carboxymethylaminomethyl(34) synthesis GTPase MnmE, partial [Lentisphaerae bacterium]|nr:tRNA uridine-5-carboxymethylaminomethyl(34) synthesis GTPase MnmE [Lentisphaerota bacterium]
SDTIAAIATAAGPAGIAIVRVSGPDSINIARRVFRRRGGRPQNFQARRLLRHGIVESQGTIMDEVLLLIMRAPHSYTGEDVVEFQGHGGSVPARRILQSVLDAGARPAEPGEFTRRAFLNGRLDLTQAEAVLDLIRSRSERAAAAALEQLAGKLSVPLQLISALLLKAAAHVEATLDFSEDDTPPQLMAEVLDSLQQAAALIVNLLATWEEGHLLREGAVVVIAGRPNVGKSTLMNALLSADRAIISPTPGTTRDIIEETLLLDGFPVRLIDTAGLRESECLVEQEGVRRARAIAGRADLLLYVIDASTPPQPDDLTHLEELPPERCLILLNKSDLPARTTPSDLPGRTTIATALTQDHGLDQVKHALSQRLAGDLANQNKPQAVISARHRNLLTEAHASINQARELLQSGREDLLVPAATFIRAAAEAVGQILGTSYYPELLNEIFSRFCVGK